MGGEEIKILLVEDNTIEAALLQEELCELEPSRFFISHVERLDEAIGRLEEGLFDIILLDLGLPDSHGLDTFVTAHERAKGIPIVVLSGLDDERLGMEAVRKGAQDYLVKGKSDVHALVRSLHHAIQRHRLLAELELSKERLNAQYRWIPIPTFTWERIRDDFVLVDLNNAAVGEVGPYLPLRTKASAILQSFPDLWDDFCRCFEEKTCLRRELVVSVLPGQEARNLRVTSVYVPPNLLMAHVENMTEQKRAEEALRKSEERFRTIFESAQDCIFLKDLSLRYTHVNPVVERLFETNASEFIGRTDEELFGKDAPAYVRDVDLRVLKGEFIEEENTRKINGMLITFNEIRAPIRNSEGQIVGLCGIARNITERKKTDFSPLEASSEYPSDAMRATLSAIRVAADKETTILLLGESGSGKDFFARHIHDHSRRSAGPFFSVNCAAVAPELAESELFGHERGAFTGAHGRKRGLLELAEGGSLLLNEIGELSLPLQAKLLTFLDTREFTRVGGEKNVSVNARLIAATNKNLEKEVETGRFREDLYYRLNVISIVIPPLRERCEDIPILVREIISRLRCEIQLSTVPDIDAATMDTLTHYSWPGNVRELRNVLERSLMLSDGKGIYLDGLRLGSDPEDWSHTITFPKDRTLNELTREVKASLIIEALRRSDGSRQRAARLLGISRYSLKHYMTSLDIRGNDNGHED